MCGIVSVYAPAGVPVERLQAATEALQTRGPDAGSLWHDDRVGLGHRRLAIVDPQRGHQPVSNEDGSVLAVVNGELYDDHRPHLEQRGHRLRSRSDSEMVCHLYEEHGLDFVDYLRGEFALLLWDAKGRRLVAVRDPFGIKPLLYARIGEQWWFASKARALFAAGLAAAWDEQAFWQAASTQYTLPDQTLFRGVRQLPPGHRLVCEAGVCRVERYRQRSAPPLGPEPIHEFRQRLEKAVLERLPLGLPVALQLSGGIDSSAVVALAARHRRDLKAFTVSFPGTPHDELAVAEELAQRHGVRHESLPLSSQQLLEALPAAVAASEGTAVNAHLSAKYLLAQHIHQDGFKVVLTGEGADEVLLGYPHFRQDLAATPEERQHIAQSNRIAAGIMVTSSPGLSLEKLQARLGRPPAFLSAKAALGAKIRCCLKADFLSAFDDQDPFLNMLGPAPLEVSPIEQASRLWNQSALANYILNTLGDGCEMAHSLEGRLPFLDAGLAAWLRQVPLELKIHQGQEKYILREAMRDVLTDRLYTRQKQPFMAPPLLIADFPPLPFVDEQKLAAAAEHSDPEWQPALTWLLTAGYLGEAFSL